MILRQVLPRRGVPHAAGFVRPVERQPGPGPLPTKPLLHVDEPASDSELRGADVLDAHLRGHRESTQRLGIRVPGDMRDALVPHVAAHILPPELGQQRVDRGPSNLGVPEPEGRLASGDFRPGLDMRTVPFRETLGCGRVPGEAGHPVGPVGDDHDRVRPVGVHVQGVAKIDPHSPVYGRAKGARDRLELGGGCGSGSQGLPS